MGDRVMRLPRTGAVVLAAVMAAGSLVAIAPPAHAGITTPAPGATVAGNVTITESSGERYNTWINIYHADGGHWAQWGNGGGALSVNWVTWGWPNGWWRIQSRGKYCKRSIFGSCVDKADRTISEFWVYLQNSSHVSVYGPSTATWDDPQSVAAHVRDAYYGYPLAGRQVQFSFGDRSAVATTDASGNAYATMPAGGSAPSTTLTATFPGDAYAVGASASMPVTIQPIPSQVVLEGPFSVTYGTETTFSARLEKAPPRTGVLAGRNLSISYGPRAASGTTDAAGRIAATWLLDMPPGAYALAGSHSDDGRIAASSASATVEAGKRAVTIQIEPPGPLYAGEEPTVGAWVRDAATGDGLPGRRVNATLGSETAVATTDRFGRAEITFADASPSAGSQTLSLAFPGSATQAAASAVGVVDVLRRPTMLALEAPSSARTGEPVTLGGTLTDARTGDPLAAQPLEFRLGTHVRTLLTDIAGNAGVSFDIDDLPGAYEASVRYAGTPETLDASEALTLDVLPRPLRLELDGHHEAPPATGPSLTEVRVRATDAITGEPFAGLPVEVTIGDAGTSSTTDASGRAVLQPALWLTPGLYDEVASSPGSPYVEAGSTSSLFGLGWEVFTDPSGAGLVAIDPVAGRVRAIAPTNDPVVDTGELDAPGIRVEGRVLSVRQGGENHAVTGQFDLLDATFSASVEQPGSPVLLARTFNGQPTVTVGDDVEELQEGAFVELQGTVADGPDTPLAWWDLDDGQSAHGALVVHRYDDDTTIDPVIVEPRLVAVDDAGATSSSALSIRVRDIDAPQAATIDLPVDGSWSSDPVVAVSGLAEADGTVSVSDGGASVLTVPVPPGPEGSQQRWSGSISLDHGDHQLTATVVDRDGYAGPPSASVLARIDLLAPSAGIAFPAPGTYDASRLAAGCATASTDLCGISQDDGSGVARVEVRIRRLADGSHLMPAGYADGVHWLPADGVSPWYVALDPERLSDGVHEVAVRATDIAGNVANAELVTITVDRLAPDAPSITAPADGAVHPSTWVTVSGVAGPSDRVLLFDDGVEVAGPLEVDDDGGWATSLTLARGTHRLTAQSLDPAGNLGPHSPPRRFDVDDLVPAPAVIRSPASGAAVAADPVRLRGDAEPGAGVTVLSGSIALGSTVAGPDGAWLLDVVLPEGAHALRTRAVDTAGHESDLGPEHLVIVDRTVPGAPTVATPQDGAQVRSASVPVSGETEQATTVEIRDGDGPVVQLDGGTGSWSSEVLLAEGEHLLSFVAVDAAGNRSTAVTRRVVVDLTAPEPTIIEAPDPGSAIGGDAVLLEGITDPFSTINVYEASTPGGSGRRAHARSVPPVATTVADADGAWRIEVPLAEGAHALSIEVIDPAGNRTLTPPLAFQVDRTAPAAPVVTTPAEGDRPATQQLTIRGTAEPGATVHLRRGAMPIASASVSGNGRWFTQVTLPPGPTTITALATDPAGNASLPSLRSFEVQGAQFPAQPQILAPLQGTTFQTREVEIVGRSIPNATIEIVGDRVIATARSSAYGLFSTVVTLPSGEHVIAARADGGSLGPARRFIVDAHEPSITSPAAGSILQRAFLVRGVADAGRQVEILDAGARVASAVARQDGTFELQITLPPGAHALSPRTGSLTGPELAVRIDGRAPTVTVDTPAGLLMPNPVRLSGSAEDDTMVARVRVVVTSSVTNQVVADLTAGCSGCNRDGVVQWNAETTLPAGAYRVEVRAIDAVGSLSPGGYRQHVVI